MRGLTRRERVLLGRVVLVVGRLYRVVLLRRRNLVRGLLNDVVVLCQHVSDSHIHSGQHVSLLVDLGQLLIDERCLGNAHLFKVDQFRMVGNGTSRVTLFEKVDASLENFLINLSLFHFRFWLNNNSLRLL